MSEKETGTNEVYNLVLVGFIIAVILSFSDSCIRRFQYLDLRDRLERLEQQP